MQNTLKLKWLASVTIVALMAYVPSKASEEQFDYEYRQRMYVVDVISAQVALDFLGNWATSRNESIKQRTLEAAKSLISTWALQPPEWLPSITPQATTISTIIYQEVSEHPAGEGAEMNRVKEELKDLIEEEALQAGGSTVTDIFSEHVIEQARQAHPDKVELIRQEKDLIQARQERKAEMNLQKEQQAKEDAERHRQAEDKIKQLVEKKQADAAESESMVDLTADSASIKLDKDVKQSIEEAAHRFEAEAELRRQEEALLQARQERKAEMNLQKEQQAEQDAERHRQAEKQIENLLEQNKAKPEEEYKETEGGGH